jgi:hypothetical protein
MTRRARTRPPLEVEDTPNPVVATLLGPDGEPLVLLYERPRLAMGFHPGDREPTRTERLGAT